MTSFKVLNLKELDDNGVRTSSQNDWASITPLKKIMISNRFNEPYMVKYYDDKRYWIIYHDEIKVIDNKEQF